MSPPRTFVDVLADLARREPGRLLLRQLHFDDVAPDTTLDAQAFDDRARLLAGAIAAHTSPGDRVVLALKPGVDYVVALYACFHARVAAITSKTPTGRRGAARFDAIVADAQAALVIVDPESRERVATSTSVAVLDVRAEAPFHDRGPNDPSDVAVIQYTSGSTSTPRGVVLEHGALFEHASALVRVARLESHHRVVTWLPPYHDMGLVATLLVPLSIGGEVVLFSPSEFAARPERWIEAIAAHGAFLSGAPDFAYARVAARMRSERAAELDLSSWKVAFDGAERVRPATIDAFTRAFAPSRFDRRAFFPAYGMAEATLAISVHRGTELPPIVLRVDEAALARDEVVRVEDGGLALVGCGAALEGVEIAIVDPMTRRAVPAQRVGEIWVRSDSAARAYFGRERESEATFGARRADDDDSRFLRTGDLGFVLDGELFVTGRLKDLIIVEGRNLYPDDLEETAETTHPDVVPHGACAVSLVDDGVERVVVVVEHTARRDAEAESIRTAVRTALAVDHELSAVIVVLVDRGAIPRTSSGKPRRAETKRMLISGELAGLGIHRSSIDDDRPVDESLVAEIRTAVARLLGVESVGAEERFLDLGAQSTVLVSLAAALSDALGASVPISAVFDAATPRELAVALARIPRRPLFRPERVHEHAGPVPLGLSQERMWFLHAIDPTSSAYNVAFTIDLDGAVDESALALAIDLVVARHETLRTRFVRESDAVVMVVDPDGPTLGVVDCESTELEAELERFANTSFDLEHAIPTRVRLFRIGPGRASLAFSIHHVAIDGAAIDVLVDELVAAYAALVERIEPELPEAPVTFADYARWQRARIADGSLEQGRAYFEARLADVPQILALPTDRPRGAGTSTAGSIHRFSIPRALLERLAALAATRGATAYMALHAAFAVFLGRHTSSSDLAIATPVANRLEPGTERIVGSLVNTVVIRSRIGESTTFVELLDRVRVECVGAYAHQDYPFERLVESLAQGRDASHAPITQVMFDYQLHRDATRHRAGVTFRGRGISRNAEQFDLTLAVVDLGERIEAAFGYRTSLFDASTIERFAARWLTLLESVVGDPFAPVAEASLVPDEERELLATMLRGPRVDSPLATVVESFERARRAAPGAVAIELGSRSITYAELDERSLVLASALVDAGVVRGDLVVLALARSPDLVAAMLAVLRIGGAYVPIDPTYPKARIAMVLDDAAPRVVLTDAASESALPDLGASGGRIVRVGAIDASARANPSTETRTTDVAYVIFTSGSTGRPKGVRVSHGALSNLLRSMERALDVRADDRLLAITTVAFDIAGLEIFLPLVAGASIVLAERDEAIDARRLAARLGRGDCTLFQATPSTYRGLVEVGAVFGASTRFLVGGEALSESLADAITEHGATLFNVYGPTETTIWSTMGRVQRGAPVSLGRPIDNTSLRVVDSSLVPVPIGAPGELIIGGAGVADGYLGRADLDAERFVVGVDPLEPSARFYRTGDRVRVRPDGSLSFLGRTDFQVKLRGHRIELGEIERAIATHPSVFACVVRLVRFAEGDERLVAHCVASLPLDTSAIRDHASASLPAFMVPSHIVGIDSLPMTPNGKIDRDALVFAPNAADVRATVAPRTETERVVAEIFASVLGIANVDAGTSFFDVGGHSFLAVRVFASIERELAVTLPLRTLFEQPTVAELARAVDEARVVDRGIVRRFGAVRRRDPMVFVHASTTDESLDVARCVSELARDREVIALRAPERPFLVLDALAAFYVQAMVHAEITEPATLVGFGLGGNIAHAMAAQLAARGVAVTDVRVVESVPAPDRRLVQLTTTMRRIAAPIAERFARVAVTPRATGLGERYRELIPPYDDAYLDHHAIRIDQAIRVFGAKGDARQWRELCAFAEDRPIARGASAREIAASLIA